MLLEYSLLFLVAVCFMDVPGTAKFSQQGIYGHFPGHSLWTLSRTQFMDNG
jgi:hypothetical protein